MLKTNNLKKIYLLLNGSVTDISEHRVLEFHFYGKEGFSHKILVPHNKRGVFSFLLELSFLPEKIEVRYKNPESKIYYNIKKIGFFKFIYLLYRHNISLFVKDTKIKKEIKKLGNISLKDALLKPYQTYKKAQESRIITNSKGLEKQLSVVDKTIYEKFLRDMSHKFKVTPESIAVVVLNNNSNINDFKQFALSDMSQIPISGRIAMQSIIKKYNLMSHQIEALKKFITTPTLYLNFEVGLGKTRTALAIAEYKDLDIFCLAPLSAIPSWHAEAEKCGFNNNLTVMTYESFRSKFNSQLDLSKTLIVFDEAHRLKSHKAKTSKKALTLFHNAPYKLMLSGTPIDKLHEIYMQFKILVPKLFPMSYTRWAQQNFYLNSFYVPVKPIRPKEEILAPVKPYLLTKTQKEVLDLPPLTKNYIKLKPKLITSSDLLHEDLTQFNSLASFITEYRVMQEDLSKYEFALDFIEDNPKTIVFVYFKDTLNYYKDKLKDKAYYISGDDKKDLHSVLTKADKPVIATYSLKEGANLQAYKNIVFHTLPLSYRDMVQAIGRIHRAGQTSHTNLYYLFSSKIDSQVYGILKNKQSVQEFFKKFGGLVDEMESEFRFHLNRVGYKGCICIPPSWRR